MSGRSDTRDGGSDPAHRPATVRLRLAPAAESLVRDGHPWIFDGSVRDVRGSGAAGDVAAVYDRRDRLLALGLYDPHSPIRVRVVHRGSPASIDDAWWAQRLEEADAARRRLFPGNGRTNGFRVVNGDGEGFAGLVVDRYADVDVVKLYTAAWRPWLAPLVGRLRSRPSNRAVVLRLSATAGDAGRGPAGEIPWQDGAVVAGELPALADRDPAHGMPGLVVFRENGLRFEADVVRGQKTGFFLDQRENRLRVRELAGGRRMLNLFSYSGAFSVSAAAGGARTTLDIDSSEAALAAARRNFERNATITPVREAVRRQTCADAFDWLGSGDGGAGGGAEAWDLVVLDPPSLARRARDVDRAMEAYRFLVRQAAARVADGGVLVAASCSAHVTREAFVTLVGRVLKASGRPSRTVEITGHAPDHPAAFPEGRYLKAVFVRFGRRKRPDPAPARPKRGDRRRPGGRNAS